METRTKSAREKERLEELLSYRILDSGEHPDFTGIVELASEICGTPISYISFIDEHRQWFKAKIGITLNEAPRGQSICEHTIAQDDLLIIPDATLDKRFSKNPYVIGGPSFRFYAGLPLISEHGFKLGTLCVIDRVPRNLGEGQKKSLRTLARQVMNLLDLHVRNLNIHAQSIALLESVQSLERAEELTKLGSWYIEVESGRQHWSRQLLRTFHFDPDRGVPDPDEYLERIHPEDRDFVRGSVEAMQQGRTPESIIFRTNPEKIPLRYLLPTVRCIYNANGDPLRFEGTVLDITLQKEAEDDITNEKELAETFINSLPGVFYLFNTAGKMLRWNKNFEMVTGYSTEEVVNMHPTDFFDPGSERPVISEKIQEALELGYAEVESHIQPKNKQKIPYYFNGRKIQYENQTCVIGVGIDISARKKAEVELRNSENKLKAFFRSTTDANIMIGKELEILAFNPAASDIVQRFSHQALKEGDAFSAIDFRRSRTKITRHLSQVLEGKSTQIEILLIDDETNENIWWLASFVPAYDAEGETFGAIVNLTNIDDTKKAGLKLKSQYEELQKTNQELDHFVYSVSHDLRAPLATVLGLINIAELDDPGPAFTNFLTLMRNSVNRLDSFIQDILDYSQNARKHISVQRIDFSSLVNDAMADLKLLEGFDRLSVSTDVADNLPFHSDPLRIGIIFNNLLSNAIKYQDQGKDKSILNIRIATDQGGASISFYDNGIGIETKHKTRIFEMFYRASERSRGAGLGLYIVKETVGKLGGSIKVDSESTKYTHFVVRLPNL
jgi:PAS domain S-box-containing protein